MAWKNFPVRRDLEQIQTQEGYYSPMPTWGERERGRGGVESEREEDEIEEATVVGRPE